MYQSRKLGAAQISNRPLLASDPGQKRSQRPILKKIQPAAAPFFLPPWAMLGTWMPASNLNRDARRWSMYLGVPVHQMGKPLLQYRKGSHGISGEDVSLGKKFQLERTPRQRPTPSCRTPSAVAGKMAAPWHGRPCRAAALQAPVFPGSTRFQGFEHLTLSCKSGPSSQRL